MYWEIELPSSMFVLTTCVLNSDWNTQTKTIVRTFSPTKTASNAEQKGKLWKCEQQGDNKMWKKTQSGPVNL